MASDSHYWLVKAPDGDVSDAVLALLASVRGQKNLRGVEVVEIVPEKRDANWMEVSLAASLAPLPTPPEGA